MLVPERLQMICQIVRGLNARRWPVHKQAHDITHERAAASYDEVIDHQADQEQAK